MPVEGLLLRCDIGGEARLGEAIGGAEVRFWIICSFLRMMVSRCRILATTRTILAIGQLQIRCYDETHSS